MFHVSGMSLTNFHRCTLARVLILHPELREAIIFGPKIAQNSFFTKEPFLMENILFRVPLRPFQVAKVDSGSKLTFGQSNER